MAEKKEEEGGKKGGGWFKALLGMVGGLLSGAVVMYFSAWVDQAVKPAKPVPNFRVEHEGCTVHFQNLSPGFTGWWDFGDGSELVPADGAHENIVHKFDRPGDYSVKLSLSNLLGEENDRTVALHVEDAPVAKQPKIVSLEAVRVSPGVCAPAMFKVKATTENAPLCIWDLGEDRPMEAVVEQTATQERMVTFDKPGNYVIELAAVNDNVIAQAKTSVSVQEAPAGAVNVVLTATDAGTLLQTRTQPCTFSDTFRPDAKGDVCPLSGRPLPAASLNDKNKAWIIRDVQLTGANGKQVNLGDKTDQPLDAAALGLPNARNLHLQLADNRSSVHLIGEMTRPSGKTGPALPSVLLQGVMTQELRQPDNRAVSMPVMLVAPAAGKTTTEIATLPALPEKWVDAQPRKLSLTVRDGANVVAQDMAVPGRVDVTVQQRRCTLVATLVKDQVRLDLTAR